MCFRNSEVRIRTILYKFVPPRYESIGNSHESRFCKIGTAKIRWCGFRTMSYDFVLIFACSFFHFRSDPAQQRTKSYENVRIQTKSYEFMRTKSHDFVQILAKTTYEIVRHRTKSYEIVRNRANSYEYNVRNRTTSDEIVAGIWRLVFCAWNKKRKKSSGFCIPIKKITEIVYDFVSQPKNLGNRRRFCV